MYITTLQQISLARATPDNIKGKGKANETMLDLLQANPSTVKLLQVSIFVQLVIDGVRGSEVLVVYYANYLPVAPTTGRNINRNSGGSGCSKLVQRFNASNAGRMDSVAINCGGSAELEGGARRRRCENGWVDRYSLRCSFWLRHCFQGREEKRCEMGELCGGDDVLAGDGRWSRIVDQGLWWVESLKEEADAELWKRLGDGQGN